MASGSSFRFKARLIKTCIVLLGAAIVSWLAFVFRNPSVEAADVASGVSALIAVGIALGVLTPRLDYLLLPKRTRTGHIAHLQHTALIVSQAVVALSGSTGRGGQRTDALSTFYVASQAVPGLHAGVLDEHIEVPDALAQELARCKKAAEEAINAGSLEGPRASYQMSLFEALGLLALAVANELGGHGYVTDRWERNTRDWLACAVKQHYALRNPLGPPAPEEQLLNLLDRLNTHKLTGYIMEPLTEGTLIRLRTSETEWTDTFKLTSAPQIIARLESGIPVWELNFVDSVGTQGRIESPRSGFEPAPVA